MVRMVAGSYDSVLPGASRETEFHTVLLCIDCVQLVRPRKSRWHSKPNCLCKCIRARSVRHGSRKLCDWSSQPKETFSSRHRHLAFMLFCLTAPVKRSNPKVTWSFAPMRAVAKKTTTSLSLFNRWSVRSKWQNEETKS
jgi:hypothetical protein